MKILLICSAGMSTSLLVTKMEKAAAEKGVEVEILAIPEAKAAEDVPNYDVVLLGPQVRFLEKKIKAIAEPHGIPVGLINMSDYGMMNGAKVLDQALGLKA